MLSLLLMQDVLREAVVTCAFCVSCLVLPELFALNNLPRFLSVLFLYPLYSFGVDSSGIGSSLSPNSLFGLDALSENGPTTLAIHRFLSAIGGGLVGGMLMKQYFPDDPR